MYFIHTSMHAHLLAGRHAHFLRKLNSGSTDTTGGRKVRKKVCVEETRHRRNIINKVQDRKMKENDELHK